MPEVIRQGSRLFSHLEPTSQAQRVGFSDFITGERKVFKDVIKAFYSETNEMFGADYKPPK